MTEIEDLAARLALLEDHEACRQLIARYGPMVDAGDHAGAAAIFANDGSYDIGGFGLQVGREAIAAMLQCEEHLGLIATGAAHVLSDPVNQLSGDKARARSRIRSSCGAAETGGQRTGFRPMPGNSSAQRMAGA